MSKIAATTASAGGWRPVSVPAILGHLAMLAAVLTCDEAGDAIGNFLQYLGLLPGVIAAMVAEAVAPVPATGGDVAIGWRQRANGHRRAWEAPGFRERIGWWTGLALADGGMRNSPGRASEAHGGSRLFPWRMTLKRR